MNRAAKKRVIKLIILFSFSVTFAFFGVARAVEIPEDEKWSDYDDYIVISHDTNWSGNVVFRDPLKEVVLVDGATLTIEKGARVELASVLRVYLGRIVAEGTAEENIIFSKTNISDLELPNGYDPDCRESITGAIEFDDYSRIFGMEPSIMRFVQFNGLGEYKFIDHDFCSIGMAYTKQENIFFPIARASDVYPDVFFPALMFSDGNLRIENSSFTNNHYADVEANIHFYENWGEPSGRLEIANSNFAGNSQNVAVKSDSQKFADNDADPVPYNDSVRLENNWYGDASGPDEVDKDSSGNGEELEGNYTLNGWSTTKFENTVVASEGASNVLFLPGIKTSRLYKDGAFGTEDQLWPPNYFGGDMEELGLGENGSSDENVYAKDIIEELPTGGNIYKTFLDQLADLKDEKTINNYKAFAYDWRLSVEDIAENGTRNQTGEMDSLLADVQALSASSKSKKVTIVAHSNGGLVAKAVMLELEKSGLAEKVDKIIFVGTPQMGTPFAILSLLYGYDESILFGTLVSRKDARIMSENMPGAYGLLPSEEYFTRTENPFINFYSENTRYKSFQDAYGDKIGDFSEFKNFLLGIDDGRSDPKDGDVEWENVLNEKILEDSMAMHQRLDSWIPPSSLQVVQIAGWGLDTISGIKYAEKEIIECVSAGRGIPVCEKSGRYEPIYEPEFSVDGDRVVTAPSALMLSEAENVKRYWVDLWSYDDLITKGREHKDLFEVSDVEEFVKNSITNTSAVLLSENIKSSRPNPDGYDNASPHLRMSLYSPLDIHLYDDAGNHTGPKTNTDENGKDYVAFEENIPNSYYYQLGERKYVGFPGREHIRVELDGYDLGSYTLKLNEVETTALGEKTVSRTTFENLPTTENTLVKLDIPVGGISNKLKLQADVNSDGRNDYTVNSTPGGVATLKNVSSDDDDDGDRKKKKEKKSSKAVAVVGNQSNSIISKWNVDNGNGLLLESIQAPTMSKLSETKSNESRSNMPRDAFSEWWHRIFGGRMFFFIFAP